MSQPSTLASKLPSEGSATTVLQDLQSKYKTSYICGIQTSIIFLISGIAGAIIFGVLVFACPVLVATLPLFVGVFLVVNFVTSCATILISSGFLVSHLITPTYS